MIAAGLKVIEDLQLENSISKEFESKSYKLTLVFYYPLTLLFITEYYGVETGKNDCQSIKVLHFTVILCMHIEPVSPRPQSTRANNRKVKAIGDAMRRTFGTSNYDLKIFSINCNYNIAEMIGKPNVKQVDWQGFKRVKVSDGKFTYHNDKYKLVMYGFDFQTNRAVRPGRLSSSAIDELECSIRANKVKLGRYDG